MAMTARGGQDDWPNRKVSNYTGAMRWHGRVLEQEVCDQSYDGDDLLSETKRWVPVPEG